MAEQERVGRQHSVIWSGPLSIFDDTPTDLAFLSLAWTVLFSLEGNPDGLTSWAYLTFWMVLLFQAFSDLLGLRGSTVVTMHGITWSSPLNFSARWTRGSRVGWDRVRSIDLFERGAFPKVVVMVGTVTGPDGVARIPGGLRAWTRSARARDRLADRAEVLRHAWMAAWDKELWPDEHLLPPPAAAIQFRATRRQLIGRVVSGLVVTSAIAVAAWRATGSEAALLTAVMAMTAVESVFAIVAATLGRCDVDEGGIRWRSWRGRRHLPWTSVIAVQPGVTRGFNLTTRAGEQHWVPVPFHVPLIAPDANYVEKVDSIRSYWLAAQLTPTN